MPVVIEELTTTLEVQDEVKIRKLVRDELRRLLREQREQPFGHNPAAIDPADPLAGGFTGEG